MLRHQQSPRSLIGIAFAVTVVGCSAGAGPSPSAGPSPEPSKPASPSATAAPTVEAPSATPEPTPSPAAGDTEGWHRVDGGVLEYSLALPPGSWLSDRIETSGGQDPYEQWRVTLPDGTPAFGLMVGRFSQPLAGATLPPATSGTTEVRTADGVPVVVSEASGINIFANAIHDDQGWLLLAESGDIVGDEARRDLLLQIISTFRFARTEVSPEGLLAPTGAGFELQFPGLPTLDIHQQSRDGVAYDLVTATLSESDATYWAGWAILPSDLGADAVHEEAVAMAEAFKGTIASEGEALVGGRPGYEFVVSSDAPCLGEAGGCRVTERMVVLDERRMVMLASVLPDPPGTSASADAFLASFREVQEP